MGMTCVAHGCKTEKKKGVKIRFFRVPDRNTDRGRLWRAAISRKAWSPRKSYDARICALHFITGMNIFNVNYERLILSIY